MRFKIQNNSIVLGAILVLFMLSLVACGGGKKGGGGGSNETQPPIPPPPPVTPPPSSWPDTRLIGTTGLEEGKDIVADKDGNVFVAGITRGSLGTPPNPDAGGDKSDMVIVKYTADGALAWVVQLGAVGHDEARAITVDASGNVYFAGYTSDNLASGAANPGGTDFVVAKYSTDGTQLWLRQRDIENFDRANGVAVDREGNVYVVGDTGPSEQNDPPNLPPDMDVFVAKYNAAGDFQWLRQFGSSSPAAGETLTGVVTDTANNIYMVGTTDGIIQPGTPAGGSDAFIAKYTPSGSQLWVRQHGLGGSESAHGIALDSLSNIYIAGSTNGCQASAPCPGNQINNGAVDFFLLKFNFAGTWQWTRVFGTTSSEEASVVSTDIYDDVFVAGRTKGSLLGYTNGGLPDTRDIAVFRFSPSGMVDSSVQNPVPGPVWAKQTGSDQDDLAFGVAADVSRGVFITGWTNGNLHGKTNTGGRDIFIIRYDLDGNP